MTRETLLILISDPEKQKIVEISIVIVGTDAIGELNLEYRGIDKPTDVLSFPMNEGEFSDINTHMLGDVVICPEVVEDNSKEFSKSFEEELEFILVHGILHLFGYDHVNSEAEANEMKQASDMILSKLSSNNCIS